MEILKNTFPTVELGDGNHLITGGKIDSIGIITIVMTLSAEYDVTLDPDDISVENFDSVENIWKLIERKKGV